MNFSGVSALHIPEGNVIKITGANGTVLWEKKNEEEYTFPEYLAFNADMVFDTGIYCTEETKIDVRFTNESETARYLYGARTTNNTASVTAYLTSSGAWRFGSTYRNVTIDDSTDVHNVIIDKNGIKVNTITLNYVQTVKAFECPWTLTIGSARTTSGKKTEAQFIGKIYHFRMYDGDTLILDWIPCTKSDGSRGFYDNVTGKFVAPM